MSRDFARRPHLKSRLLVIKGVDNEAVNSHRDMSDVLPCVGPQLSHKPLSACHGVELMGEMRNVSNRIGGSTCTEVNAEIVYK